MDFGKKQSIVVFLDRQRFDLYCEEQNQTYHFDLSSYVANLEIINIEDLRNQIKNFVETSKITPGNITIVLSESILFVKGLPQGIENEDEDTQVQKFIDSVPFEHVGYRSYQIENGKLLVAASKDFYSGIKICFEKCGFTINIIAPIYAAPISIDPSQGLDENTGRLILKSADALRQGGLEITEEKTITTTATAKITPQKPDRKRLLMMLSLFGVLIVILVIVLISSQPSPNPSKNTQAGAPNNSAPQPTAVRDVQTSSINLTSQTVRIKIVNIATASASAETLKGSLNTAGFENVLLEVSNTSQPTGPVITFTSNTPADLRTEIANNVSRVAGNFTIEEGQISEADVLIFLVK